MMLILPSSFLMKLAETFLSSALVNLLEATQRASVSFPPNFFFVTFFPTKLDGNVLFFLLFLSAIAHRVVHFLNMSLIGPPKPKPASKIYFTLLSFSQPYLSTYFIKRITATQLQKNLAAQVYKATK